MTVLRIRRAGSQQICQRDAGQRALDKHGWDGWLRRFSRMLPSQRKSTAGRRRRQRRSLLSAGRSVLYCAVRSRPAQGRTLAGRVGAAVLSGAFCGAPEVTPGRRGVDAGNSRCRTAWPKRVPPVSRGADTAAGCQGRASHRCPLGARPVGRVYPGPGGGSRLAPCCEPQPSLGGGSAFTLAPARSDLVPAKQVIYHTRRHGSPCALSPCHG